MYPAEFQAPNYAAGNNGRGRGPILSLLGRKPRYWLHILLFVLTLISTSVVGSRMQENFDHNLPFFDIDRDLDVFLYWWQHPAMILQGAPFSLTLLLILLAHEFGHFLTCVHYRVDASLPYFLPAPTFAGTFGAFIRIRSPICYRRTLFDIGVAGPVAGFVFVLPVLAIGMSLSKTLPGIAREGSLAFGTPVLQRLLEQALFPGVPAADIYLHPVARAAWIGMFATALNLLPIGQLDGGHILYSLFGNWHKTLTKVFLVVLVPIGFVYWRGWLVWAVLLFFLGRKHPTIYDPSSLGAGRQKLAVLALAMFLLCFTLAPVETPGG